MVLLVLLNVWIVGGPLPAPGPKGLWFGLAFFGLAVGKLLQEPRFTSPATGISNGAVLIFLAIAIDPSDLQVAEWLTNLVRLVIAAYGLLALTLASVAIVKRDEPPVGRPWYRAATTIGQATAANSVALFATALVTFPESPARIVAIHWFWLIAILVEPVERLIAFWLSNKSTLTPNIGRVIAVEDPALVVIGFGSGTHLELGREVTLGQPPVTGRIVEKSSILGQPQARVFVTGETSISPGNKVTIGVETDENIVGHVGERTELDEVVLEVAVAANERGLAEERLVEIPIREKNVLYQIVSAEIREDTSRRQKRRLLRVVARKLGVWNADRRRFDVVSWLPAPDATAILLKYEEATFEPEAIGHVPGTLFGVAIDIDAAVTHNTAILGILGVGKTTLSYELIRRMAIQDIKVVVLDISGHYAPELAALINGIDETATTDRTNAATKATAEAARVKDGEAGSLPELRAELRSILEEFYDDDDRHVVVLNPNAIRATRLEGFLRNGKAEQWAPLTAVEVTRVIAEVVLALAQERESGRSDEDKREQKAAYCLVLEEAHSLVPEFSSVTSKMEEHAVAGTVRALLQGRKYGLGAVVITQRTANVTKSVLNQCNTVFAMRVYDNTGMEFLANYIGKSYSKLLAVLQDHHAIFFGRGSGSRAPIVIALNNPDDSTPALEEELTRDNAEEIAAVAPEN